MVDWKKSRSRNVEKKINEKDKYIKQLENKINCIKYNKLEEDEYEQYSKKMILRNIKDLTNENEELQK